MEKKYIVPVVGKIYTNRAGGEYLCAHGVLEYEDGTIEWNYSTKGHFAR